MHVYALVSLDEAMTGPISHPTLCVYIVVTVVTLTLRMTNL